MGAKKVKKEKRTMGMCLRSEVHKHLHVDRYGVVGHLVLGQSNERVMDLGFLQVEQRS